MTLHLRRLTAGKGRTVIEISNLPKNESWCRQLAKDLKKSLGVGGTFKKGVIEIFGEKMSQVQALLEERSLSTKKIGG